MESRQTSTLAPYVVLALGVLAALAVRPVLAGWVGEGVAFVVLCTATVGAVWFVGARALARRVDRERAAEVEAAHQAQMRTGRQLESARLLAAIVEASDDAIVSKSLGGMILSWNAAAERLFGYSAEQAIGQHISIIIPPERLAEEDAIVQRLSVGERVEPFETLRKRRDGRRIPISLTVSPIKDDAGRVVGASKIARDISARKKADALLRQKDERLRLATRTGKVGIWEWDTASGSIAWTDSLYEIHGVSKETFPATYEAFMQLVHPEEREFVDRSLRDCAQGTGSCSLEFRTVGEDGAPVWVFTTAVGVQNEHDGTHLIGATLDITDRRRAEESLRAADRRKDEFLATLAHELRNPLAPIWTAAQVLKLKGAADPDLQWSSDVIDRQMRQMVRLLEDLLDVSRISRNKLVLRKEPVELATMIHTAVETSRPLIDTEQHTLEVRLPAEPIHLYSDPVRLAQVFSNLLNNAARYMRSGGRIFVEAERRANRVAVTVRDEGIGIAPEKIPDIFEMFSQATPPEHRTRGGLGIGLSLARALVQLHGGTIEARSAGLDQGSEFVVNLPLAVPFSPAATPGQDARLQAQPELKRRVLVVDDLKDSADSLAALLRIKGHDVHTVYDGPAALKSVDTLHPNVILLDIGLPKMSGYDVCRMLRERPDGEEFFIVALTGWGQPADRLRTEEAGFDWHLVKPVDAAALADLLVSLPVMGRRSRRRVEQPPEA